jgi:RND family efflux transporter MFP subunit
MEAVMSVSLTSDVKSPPRRAAIVSPAVGLAWASSVFIAVLTGCEDRNKYVEPPPPEVTVAYPVQREVTNYVEATGTAQPVLTVEIRARVKGFLKERHFKEGAVVKKDELLLVIDEEPFRLQLDQAKTRLAEAEAALRKANQSRAREVARAQLALDESQLLLARIEEGRQRSLMSRNAATREELDRADANRKKNEAQVEATHAHLDQAEADYKTNILAAEASSASAQTAVRNAEIELSYCKMYSPMDGRISKVNFDVGNLVGDGQASLLATVVKIDPIYAYSNVSETDLLRTRSRSGDPSRSGYDSMPMELGLANEEGYPHQGRSDYQDPGVDSGTGTIRVRGVFPNPDGTILPGLFVRIRVPLDRRKDALMVPERALGTDQSGQYVLVVGDDNVVDYRPVRVGVLIDGFRVVDGKIGPKDRVVVDGLLRARPKLKVTPKLEEADLRKVAALDSVDSSPAAH